MNVIKNTRIGSLDKIACCLNRTRRQKRAVSLLCFVGVLCRAVVENKRVLPVIVPSPGLSSTLTTHNSEQEGRLLQNWSAFSLL